MPADPAVTAVLQRTAELLRNPDRVVLDPHHLYEDPSGVEMPVHTSPSEVAVAEGRACFLGAFRVAAAELNCDSPDPYGMSSEVLQARSLLAPVVHAHSGGWGTFTGYLEREGGPACADLIDEALAGVAS